MNPFALEGRFTDYRKLHFMAARFLGFLIPKGEQNIQRVWAAQRSTKSHCVSHLWPPDDGPCDLSTSHTLSPAAYTNCVVVRFDFPQECVLCPPPPPPPSPSNPPLGVLIIVYFVISVCTRIYVQIEKKWPN